MYLHQQDGEWGGGGGKGRQWVFAKACNKICIIEYVLNESSLLTRVDEQNDNWGYALQV